VADGQASRPGGRSSGRRAAAAAASKHRDRAGLTVAQGSGAGGGGRACPGERAPSGWRVGQRVICLYTFISCIYNRSDMHRYKRLYLFIYVHIIMQICTDINVYIRLYFSGRYKQDMCILFI